MVAVVVVDVVVDVDIVVVVDVDIVVSSKENQDEQFDLNLMFLQSNKTLDHKQVKMALFFQYQHSKWAQICTMSWNLSVRPAEFCLILLATKWDIPMGYSHWH